MNLNAKRGLEAYWDRVKDYEAAGKTPKEARRLAKNPKTRKPKTERTKRYKNTPAQLDSQARASKALLTMCKEKRAQAMAEIKKCDTEAKRLNNVIKKQKRQGLL